MEQHIEDSAAPGISPAEDAAVTVPPGVTLREARERLGLSTADAAAQIKLASRQIEALEAGDYEHLPEMTFVRGFVRSYAKVLGLDPQPLLAALPQAKPVSVQVSPASVEVPFPDARSPQLQNLIWLGAALLLAVVVVAFAVYHYTTPTKPSVPDVPVETAIPLPTQMQIIPASAVAEAVAASSVAAEVHVQPALPAAKVMTAPPAQPVASVQPVAIKPAAPVAAPTSVPPAAKPVQTAATPLPAAKPVVPPVTPPVANKPAAAQGTVQAPAPAATPTATPTASSSSTLRLTFGEESWTEVRDKNGNIVSSQLNPAGSELSLKGQGPFSLVVGRASSARLTYKGKTIDLKPNTNATSDVARVTLE